MLSHNSMQRDKKNKKKKKVLLSQIILKLVSHQEKQLPTDSLGLSLNLFSLEKSEVNCFPTLVQLVVERPAALVRAYILSVKIVADTFATGGRGGGGGGVGGGGVKDHAEQCVLKSQERTFWPLLNSFL